MAISVTSRTLTAFDLRGDPLGEAGPYYQTFNNNKSLIKSIIVAVDHLQGSYSGLPQA